MTIRSRPQGMTYLFVDGGHFRQYFDERTQSWFEQPVDFNFARIKAHFECDKAFYYDCVDDRPGKGETSEIARQRAAAQEDRLNRIREIDGCHVHLGSLSGTGKKKRQKEVDVLLTVHMLEHAVRGNMRNAVLLTGDNDFRPLVESLVRLGLFVEIAGDREHLSVDLVHAADSHRKLAFTDYYDWTNPDQISLRPINFPTNTIADPQNHFKTSKFWCIRKGKLRGSDISIFTNNQAMKFLVCPGLLGENTRSTVDLDSLLLFIDLEYGKVIWEEISN